MKGLVPCDPTAARHRFDQAMYQPAKKKTSYLLAFLFGFLTGVLGRFISPIFDNWPAFKKAIASWWS